MKKVKHYKFNYEKKKDAELIDTELIKSFKKGEESAFSQIVLKYQYRLLHAATIVLGDENEAKDLVQDAFVKAYFNLKSFRGNSSLYTWLYRILYNLCISSLRRKKIISFLRLDSQDESIDFTSQAPDPEEVYERKEILLAVKNAVKKLPVKQRMVFTMKQFEGLRHVEIAEIMGITEGAVKSSYFHAVKKLREMLNQYGGEYGM